MTENLKNFLKFVVTDEETLKKAKELKIETPEEAKKIAIVFAKEHGFELNEADFEAPEGELSEGELADVAGGSGECYCALAGGGGGTSDAGTTFGCACVGYGQGGDAKYDDWMCVCVAAGVGDDIIW